MKKPIKIKTIMILSLIVGIIGYSYIMIFKNLVVLEILALIFFTFVIQVSSEYVHDKDYYGFTILNYIKEKYNGFSKKINSLYPISITLLTYFSMKRKY